MPKKGQRDNDSNGATSGRNNPSESVEITAGTPKKRETYDERARMHLDPDPVAQHDKPEKATRIIEIRTAYVLTARPVDGVDRSRTKSLASSSRDSSNCRAQHGHGAEPTTRPKWRCGLTAGVRRQNASRRAHERRPDTRMV